MSKKLVLIGFLLAFVAFLTIKFVHSQTSTTPQKPKEFNERVLWSLIQNWKGNQSYIEDQKLCDIASKRSLEVQQVFSHKKFLDDYSSLPYDIAENLHSGTDMSEQKSMNDWLISKKHREILERNYKYSCLRCSKNNGTDYCVQIFSSF